MEKNRSQTEQRLINAVEELIIEKGFEKLGIRAVAEKAGVDKTLIYRYFKSLDCLIYACLKRHDFWSNTSIELPDPSDTLTFVKEIFRKQVVHFRNNEILKRLQRWELSNENAFVSELKKQREENGLERIRMISRMTKIPYADLAAIGSIITAGICYLAMLEETCQYYNGINIRSDEGWEQLIRGIDNILNLKYNENGN